MIKNYLSIVLRRLKVFLTRQPEKVVDEVFKEFEDIIEELRNTIQVMDKEYNEALSAQRAKLYAQINMLSTTIANLTQALAHTNVHFKTIKTDNKESK